MLVNVEALFRCALERRESRGAHARSDYPKLDPKLGEVNFVVRRAEDGAMSVQGVENEAIPYDLLEVIGQHFTKYTPEETE
jgi:succinate dehydrogenase/fumarate reductase flavoprotein subunit